MHTYILHYTYPISICISNLAHLPISIYISFIKYLTTEAETRVQYVTIYPTNIISVIIILNHNLPLKHLIRLCFI